MRDAGGTVIRLRAIRVPVDAQAVKEALRRRQGLATLAGPDSMADVGAQLAREFVTGGRMPVWEALAGTLVEERDGVSTAAADAVVVARPVDPQRGATRKLLASLYETLSGTGIAAVGVDREGRVPSSIGAFQAAGLSTVDSVNTAAGRLALVLLLAGADPGNYGVEESAGDGILPPVAPSNTRHVTGEETLCVLVAARDEEQRIARTVRQLRASFPTTVVIVADDGSRDTTAATARAAGATVVSLRRRGKGQALTLAERECPPGPLHPLRRRCAKATCDR